jgi:2-dehydropantoate 2-reductase
MPVRIAVVGVGAEGGFFGALLANAGNDVTLIARGQNLDALRTNGLFIKSNSLGDIRLSVKATDRPAEVDPVDLIMFCVKTYDLDSAAQQMSPLIRKGTVIIPVQNGVEAADRIGKIVGSEHLLGGVSWVSARVEKPGVIIHGGSTRLVFGELAGGVTRRTEEISKVLKGANIAAELHPNIRQALWEKMVSNAAAAGVFSLIRLPAGPVRDCPDSMQLLRDTMEENVVVAKACGVAISERFVDDTMRELKGYASWVRPSMLVDLMAGHRLELDATVGTIVRLGREKGVETPINSTIYRALLPHANGAPPNPTPPGDRL